MGGGIAPVYQTLFGASAPTTYPADLQEIVLGVQVQLAVKGLIVGVRYYRDAGDDGEHWAHIVDPTTNKVQRISVAKLAPPGGSGVASWQHVYLHPYYPVVAGQSVIVDCYFEKGRWWYTPGMYAGADFVSGDITAPQHVAGVFFNGVFAYFKQIKTTGDGGGNGYGVDLLFLPRP